MRTTTIIVFYLILFLLGMAITGVSQGIVNDGGYITGTSANYMKYSGSGDAFLISSTADRTVLGNLTVDFTGSGTYTLTITDTSFATLEGNLSLSDTLILGCDTSNMASLITKGTISGSYAKVEQYLKQDQWHMVSSPVSSAQADVYTGLYLMEWNEPDSTWSYLTSLTDPLNVTEGYFAWSSSSISSPEYVNFDGLLNTGNQTVANLSYNSGSNKGDGWNLVGNPYPSPIEWTSSWTKSNIDATIYVYDGTQYLTWNYNFGGIGSMGNGYIPSTQAFWVKANASSPSMTIPNSTRTHASQQFYKGSDEIINNMLTITVVGNEFEDVAIVGCHAGATDLYDGEYDAYKLFGSTEAPQLYSVIGNTNLTANFFGEIKSSRTVDLGLNTGEEGVYEFHFSGAKNFDDNIIVYLEDKASTSSNGQMIDLKKSPSYKFYTEEGLDESRFVLHFIEKSDINYEYTGNPAKSDVQIYSYEKDVIVNYRNEIPGTMIVYDLLGKEIARSALSENDLNKLRISAGKGYYVVKVISGNSIESKKVFIN